MPIILTFFIKFQYYRYINIIGIGIATPYPYEMKYKHSDIEHKDRICQRHSCTIMLKLALSISQCILNTPHYS